MPLISGFAPWLRRLRDWLQRIDEGLIGRLPGQPLMRSPPVVEVQIAPDGRPRLRDGRVGVQIHLLVLQRSPEALDEDVVAPRALAVHADGDAVADQHRGEGPAGELRALIGVEYLGLAEPRHRLLDGSMQKPTSMVMDSRQASTLRLNQSITAAR